MIDLITQRMKFKDLLGDIDKRFPDYAAAIRSAFGEVDDEAVFMRRVFTPTDLELSEDEKAIVGTITSIQRDYYNEVVLPEGMNTDVYTGIVLYNHDYSRDDIPHARNMWIKPKADKTALVAKTGYITDLSDLGRKVYQYRERKYPMGQSIGFYPQKSVTPDDDGWEKVYDDWKERYTKMMLDRGAKKTKIDTSPPDAIYTKWALLEYSDVFIGANPDAVQMAVTKGLIPQDKAEEYTILDLDLDMVLRPFANEHACTLKNPDTYDSFARKNCEQKHNDKCIDVIYGIKEGKSEIQALRYPKDVWGVDDARAHCKSRDGSFEQASEDAIAQPTFAGINLFPAEDADWNAEAEVRAADVDDLKLMCAWYDCENAPDVKILYKVIHHRASEGHACIWRGVASAMAALLGARGGVDIIDSNRHAMYDHLAKHYETFDKDPPDFRQYTESELKFINAKCVDCEREVALSIVIDIIGIQDLWLAWKDTIICISDVEVDNNTETRISKLEAEMVAVKAAISEKPIDDTPDFGKWASAVREAFHEVQGDPKT